MGSYKQRWVRVTGTREKAEAKLTALLHEVRVNCLGCSGLIWT